MAQFNQQGMPQGASPFVDLSTGNIKQAWLQLLINLWNRTGGAPGGEPPAYTPVVVGSSPFTYEAAISGNVFISPGTYADVTIIRGGLSLDYGQVTRGIFPLRVGDTIVITYTTLTPTVYFI